MCKRFRFLTVFSLVFFFAACATKPVSTMKARPSIPAFVKGDFTDDYAINYTISDTLWVLKPNAYYHILRYDAKGMYIIAQNDRENSYAPGLYSRIDIMRFSNMAPYEWGFCLTTFDAKTPEEAVTRAVADRANPRKGCGGYPFSRMKKRQL
jgi:hypothetical protein